MKVTIDTLLRLTAVLEIKLEDLIRQARNGALRKSAAKTSEKRP